tara:strand:- start:859 stop:1014 length:156 start_codon:yes stop_codon:yes gene_type:complete
LKFKFDDIIKIVLGYVVLYALTLKTIQIILTLPIAYLIGMVIMSLYDEYKR